MAEGDGAESGGVQRGKRTSGPFRATAERDAASPRPVCPFLAIEMIAGSYGPAIGLDPANRCTAIGEPVPQSGRQQELVCLTGAHVNCPRYLRGVVFAATPAPASAREPIAPAVIGAALVLVAALAASFGFLAVRGGFNLPAGTPSPAAVAIVGSPPPSLAPSPTAFQSEASATSPIPSSTPSAIPTPTPEPVPTATPVPTPARTPAPPKATPTPGGTSDRYAVLTKCPSTPDCWIYVIRSGDNLRSIANWFGVSYSRMLAMNPSLNIPIHAGDHLKIPTPTR